MGPRPPLALAVFLMFTCLSSRAALADACDTPPPPRFQPGQVDNYPNGADVITCTKPVPGREIWRIDYPSVDRSLTDYPAITFKRGDAVALSASGCVQSGGFGWNTWKRYVDPDDGNGHLDTLYFGTVQIVGITGNNNPQSIKHWIGPAIAIPTDGHLALGYVDDDLSDNGYWNHDDGLNDQCVGLSKSKSIAALPVNTRIVANGRTSPIIQSRRVFPNLRASRTCCGPKRRCPSGFP